MWNNHSYRTMKAYFVFLWWMNPYKSLLLQIHESYIITTYSTYMKEFLRIHSSIEIQTSSSLVPLWVTSHSETETKAVP